MRSIACARFLRQLCSGPGLRTPTSSPSSLTTLLLERTSQQQLQVYPVGGADHGHVRQIRSCCLRSTRNTAVRVVIVHSLVATPLPERRDSVRPAIPRARFSVA